MKKKDEVKTKKVKDEEVKTEEVKNDEPKKVVNKKKVVTSELPQNIVMVGDRVTENKNIYIHQKVYAKIQKFASTKTKNEHGGILVGRVVNRLNKENTIIEGFIPAKYNAATPTTLTFTHETWEHFHREIDKKYKGKKIVGWIHTHPDFGIFLSDNDKFIQGNFFNDKNQVAYVVDPIRCEEGFYFWIDEKLEQCPGFYIFDKNGVKIDYNPMEYHEEEEETKPATKTGLWVSVCMALLAIALTVNIVINFNLSGRIEELEDKVSDQEVLIQALYGFSITGKGIDVSKQADIIRTKVDALKAQYQKSLQPVEITPGTGKDGTDGGQAETEKQPETQPEAQPETQPEQPTEPKAE